LNIYDPPNFSFSFRGRNSHEMGLLANSYDFVLPPKRERKQPVPFRHGTYDYGSKWYDERVLRLRCVWITERVRRMTRADIREVSFWLSQKGQIRLDVEPDKYYVGELFEPSELVAHYNYAKEDLQTGSTDTTTGEFTLEFTCEPFALRTVVTQDIASGTNRIDYKGTAETPCVIILRNPNSFAVSNVQVAVVRRK